MRDYFLRRFLLIPPTLIGVTIIVFAITRLVPGGPLERAIMESQMLDAASGVSTQSVGQGMALSESQLQQLKEYYLSIFFLIPKQTKKLLQLQLNHLMNFFHQIY